MNRRAWLAVACTFAGSSNSERETFPLPVQRSLRPNPSSNRFGPLFVRMNSAAAEWCIVSGLDEMPQGLGWRWTRETALLGYRIYGVTGWKLRVEFGIVEATFRKTGPVSVAFRVNQHLVGRPRYERPGDYAFQEPVQPGWLRGGEVNLVSLEVDPPYVDEADKARLGVTLHAAGFVPSVAE